MGEQNIPIRITIKIEGAQVGTGKVCWSPLAQTALTTRTI